MSEIKNNTAYANVKSDLNSVGGLRIYTTLSTAGPERGKPRGQLGAPGA